jgi:type I restriction enzyme M protein
MEPRVPPGVFAPYADIPSNLLFFDRNPHGKHVWYYEHPLPEGRKSYTKTNALKFEEFADCLKWWKKREENDRAWRVSTAELLADGCNLDRKNPRGKEDITHLPPAQLVADILQKEKRIAEVVENIRRILAEKEI